MSSNAIGTLFRIALIALGLFCVWFFSVGVIYFLATLLFGFEFSINFWIGIFLIVILFRMFYPKNVFV